ncbi:2-C-methyl-D-erythritol 4-phosphate cytidylyltransferase [Paraglaciecola sp.]|uniref:2-C-methyl-D-erythritol 4-phosphate cytidylyltransferase n=1 Tax=Paraglaciecola sp. TaxID=1920173 RepID=UPI003EF8E867
MSSKSLYSVVVPAAGVGKRMLSELPKQYLTIAKRTLIEHTILRLLEHPKIKRVLIVLNPEDKVFKTLPIAQHPKVETTLGGKERADSVLAGLQYLPNDEQWVLVHDAARPCLALEDLTKLLALAEQSETGGILATRVRDTMKRSDSNKTVLQTESRENLWHALTPQFFKLDELKFALEKANQENQTITDEASAIEYIGKPVKLVEGHASNLKVTQPEDLLLAEFYLTQSKSDQSLHKETQ